MEAVFSALVYLALLGAVGTLARLAASGLWRRYLWFSAWAISNILKSAILSYVSGAHGISSQGYAFAWRYCTIATSILLIGAGIEAYLHIANDYPRIGNYGRRVLAWASLAAIGIALMPAGMETLPIRMHNATVAVGVLTRSSAIAVGVGLWLAVSRIRSVPIPERKNLFRHRWILMAYCAGQAAGMSLMVHTGNRQWSVLYIGTAAVCWCLWSFFLTKDGEALLGKVDSAQEKAEIENRWTDFRQWIGLAASSRQPRI